MTKSRHNLYVWFAKLGDFESVAHYDLGLLEVMELYCSSIYKRCYVLMKNGTISAKKNKCAFGACSEIR